MTVEVIEALPCDKSVVQQLLELYLYDFSEFAGYDLDQHGRFGYPYLDHYWTDADREAFLVRVDGQLAGLVMVRERELQGATGHSVAEFFVLRKYRSSGVGAQVAREIIGRHPGHWSLEVMEQNPALAFWRRVTAAIAPSGVREEPIDGRRVRLQFVT